ncbi:MAG: pitrilysin family protein [Bdellovibrionota bacterium]
MTKTYMQWLSVFFIVSICGCAAKQVQLVSPEVGPSYMMEAPELLKAKAFHAPKPIVFTAKNGLTVLLLKKDTLPLVKMRFVFRGGKINDGSKSGLAQLSLDLLDEGYGTTSVTTMSEQLANIGSGVSSESYTETLNVDLYATKAHIDRTFEIASKVITQPRLAQEDFERIKIDQINYIQRKRKDPVALAAQIMWQEAMGPSHPYGPNSNGSPDSVAKITKQDVQTFLQTYVQPTNAALIVAGDITEKKVQELVEKYLSTWKNTNQSTDEVALSTPVRAQKQGTRLFLVNKADAQQSVIYASHLGLSGFSEDTDILAITNVALGGSFTSRLNQNLRENKGYTYSIWSRHMGYRIPTLFYTSTSVKTDATAASVQEIFHEFQAIQQKGITSEEVLKSKALLTKSFISRFEDLSGLLNEYEFVWSNQLPYDYYDGVQTRQQQATLASAQQVAKKVIDWRDMDIVIVGDVAKIKSQLAQLDPKVVDLKKAIYPNLPQ